MKAHDHKCLGGIAGSCLQAHEFYSVARLYDRDTGGLDKARGAGPQSGMSNDHVSYGLIALHAEEIGPRFCGLYGCSRKTQKK